MTHLRAAKRLQAAVFLAVLPLFLGTFHMAAQTSGKSSELLTKKELKTLVATAKTPADHMKLARHFKQEADRLEAEAKEHEELAAEYRKTPVAAATKTPMSGHSAEHCEYFAKSTREAAKAARELAASHEKMAKEAK